MNDKMLSPEELLADDGFIAWCKKTDAEQVAYWDKRINANPHQLEAAMQAVEILKALSAADANVGAHNTGQALDRLLNAVREMKKPTPVINIQQRRLWWAGAAAVLAIIVTAVVLFTYQVRYEQYATDFGETRAIVLPDGSQVTLNANSKLRVSKGWKGAAPREVWLEGEGFFSVRHTVHDAKFIVHTDDINVEVLGTEFNLQNRSTKTTVVLHNGKVQVTELNRPGAPPVIMKPGDLVQYDGKTEKISKRVVNSEQYSAWKEGKMVFSNAGFEEIAKVLEENYGLKVKTRNIDSKQQQFNGVFPANNLQVLVTALEKAYNFKIVVNDKEIIISKN